MRKLSVIFLSYLMVSTMSVCACQKGDDKKVFLTKDKNNAAEKLEDAFFKSNPEVVYRGQTKEEAFSYVTRFIRRLPWYKENGYNVGLPEHKDFESVYQKPELFADRQEEYLKKLFYEGIYDISEFDASLKIIKQSVNVVKSALEKLAILAKNWGFSLKSKYDIMLTLYGPGGSYHWEGDVGGVITKARFQGKPRSIYSFTKTIIHEIVHIGIERDIVRKYNLKHWEKERLVDLICSLYLKDLLPNYKNQKIEDKKIDKFVDKEAILYDLPSAIKSFIAQNPRSS